MVINAVRSVLALLFISVSTGVLAEPAKILAHYADVLELVANGGHLQAISSLNKCVPAANDTIKFGSAQFDHFLAHPVERRGQLLDAVGASTTMLVNKQGRGFVVEYIKLHVLADDSVEFFLQYLNPTDYSAIQPGVSYQCRLNANKNSAGGMTLFGWGGEFSAESESDSKSAP